ncbi:hypothetical protein FGO68_gene11609 [Halteria grandinella]|uniref:Uncharacterized protein n=1 Tax=Halteria grandinella TaxID=5974 RepID=A0A8J8T437_HALGN|nr:hypothetical protein FGO68_gene11609 [Halteria grandinella]
MSECQQECEESNPHEKDLLIGLMREHRLCEARNRSIALHDDRMTQCVAPLSSFIALAQSRVLFLALNLCPQAL